MLGVDLRLVEEARGFCFPSDTSLPSEVALLTKLISVVLGLVSF